MKTIRSFVNRYTLPVFFCLAYALSWWGNLFEAHTMLPIGPLFAALIVLALVSGRTGVVDFLRRIGRWRVGLHWYGVVILLPLVLVGAAIGLNLLLGAQTFTPPQMPPLLDLLETSLFVLLAIGLGEEPAWRGFALPRLMKGRSALAASLWLAVIHALWHLPLFGLEYDLQNGLPWLLQITAGTIVFTWVYNNTQGSLLLPVLLHTSVNLSAKYLFGPSFTGGEMVQLWWLVAGLWCIVALVTVVITGPSLARRHSRALPITYAGQPTAT